MSNSYVYSYVHLLLHSQQRQTFVAIFLIWERVGAFISWEKNFAPTGLFLQPNLVSTCQVHSHTHKHTHTHTHTHIHKHTPIQYINTHTHTPPRGQVENNLLESNKMNIVLVRWANNLKRRRILQHELYISVRTSCKDIIFHIYVHNTQQEPALKTSSDLRRSSLILDKKFFGFRMAECRCDYIITQGCPAYTILVRIDREKGYKLYFLT